MRLSLVLLILALGSASQHVATTKGEVEATTSGLRTRMKTDHFAIDLPGKWHADTAEKSEVSEFWSYQQDDGPGALTVSLMTLRPKAAADPRHRHDALAGIVQARKQGLHQMAGDSLKLSPDEVADGRGGARSISLSYVDLRNGVIGRYSALLSGERIVTGMYYEQAAPAAETLVRERAEIILRQFCMVR